MELKPGARNWSQIFGVALWHHFMACVLWSLLCAIYPLGAAHYCYFYCDYLSLKSSYCRRHLFGIVYKYRD